MANSIPPITIYVMPGSQFSAKVLVALDSRNIPHTVQFVSPQPSKRKLPSGGRMVPEMLYNKDVMIPDSDAILHHMDKHHNTGFYPSSIPEVTQVCARASEHLACFIYYYNWVQEDSYRRSMAMSFERYLPAFVCCFRQTATDFVLSGARKQFAEKAGAGLNMDPDKWPDDPVMLEKLVEELLYFQGLLKTEQQTYIVPGTTQLTAADAALYTQIERLVGDEGDAKVPAALPSLLHEPRLARLWRWHTQMREKHPIRFKGKRPLEAAEE